MGRTPPLIGDTAHAGAPTVDHTELLERLADAVVVADLDMRVLYANPAAEKLLGYGPTELTGRPVTDIVPTRLRDAHVAGVARYRTTGTAVLVDGRPAAVIALRADGAEQPVELSLSAVPGDGGAVRIVAVLRDLRERIELERHRALGTYLRASMDVSARLQSAQSVEAALHDLLPALCDRLDWDFAALWRVGPDSDPTELSCVDVWEGDGSVAAAFVAGTRATRLRAGMGLAGRVLVRQEPVWVVDPGTDPSLPRHALFAAAGFRTGVALPLLGANRVHGAVELLSTDQREIDDHLVALLTTIGRQIGQFLDRAAAEEEIRRSESRYRSLVEASALDVWRCSVDGGVTTDMPWWRSVTGQSGDEVLGYGWLEAVRPEDRAGVQSGWAHARDTVTVYEDEYGLRAANGELLTVVVRAVPILADGRLTEWMGTTADVTAERRANAARIELAESLQASLLPPRLPTVARLDLAALYETGGDGLAVGGDFYDLYPASPSEWTAVVGDVCGTGPAAVAVTAAARHALHGLAVHETGPAATLRGLNAALLQDAGDRRPFLTAVNLRIAPRPDAVGVTIACAGHPLPLRVRVDGSVEPVGVPGTLLGVFDEVDVTDVAVELDDGESLVLYTDGLTEARGDGGSLFGEDRLAAVLSAAAGCTAEEIVERVRAAVAAFRRAGCADDVALLVLRVEPR
ncbi:MAG TPA: SpoIIE family protein phosphatase [Mycobacteriales bacterium]